MPLPSNPNSDAPEQVLSDRDLEYVERFAEYSTPQEVCDYFGMAYEELLPTDRYEFDLRYKKGKCNARDTAFMKLKQQMDGKQGLQASLAILSRFGAQWEHSEQVAGVKSFKVTLD